MTSLRRLLWFLGLWGAGVTALAALGYGIKILLGV